MPKYTKKSKKRVPMKTCCVCMESIGTQDETRITCCRHRYHHRCIKQWSRKENTCPQCRKRFNWMIHNKKREKVKKKDQSDNVYSFIGSLLYSFFNNIRFREVLTIGIYERSRHALQLFYILKDIVRKMRTFNTYPSVVDEPTRVEAYTWLDTMERVSRRRTLSI